MQSLKYCNRSLSAFLCVKFNCFYHYSKLVLHRFCWKYEDQPKHPCISLIAEISAKHNSYSFKTPSCMCSISVFVFKKKSKFHLQLLYLFSIMFSNYQTVMIPKPQNLCSGIFEYFLSILLEM